MIYIGKMVNIEYKPQAEYFPLRLQLHVMGKKAILMSNGKDSFVQDNPGTNYVGVKYHVLADLPESEIGLHNFPGGYCGISKIEGNRYCFCYLTKSENLKNNKQSISDMEKNILKQNPVLGKILNDMTVLSEAPGDHRANQFFKENTG